MTELFLERLLMLVFIDCLPKIKMTHTQLPKKGECYTANYARI